MGLTKAERQRADDVIQELLDLVDDGHIAAEDRDKALIHTAAWTGLRLGRTGRPQAGMP